MPMSVFEHFQYIVRDKIDGRRNKYDFTYPSIQDSESEQETGAQYYPTKEMAEAWAIKQRPKKQI
jgi:hypothetical protein